MMSDVFPWKPRNFGYSYSFGARGCVEATTIGDKKITNRTFIPDDLFYMGKKKKGFKAYTALLQRGTFNREPQRKDFGGRYGYPGSYRVFVSTTGLECFPLRPEKFPK